MLKFKQQTTSELSGSQWRTVRVCVWERVENFDWIDIKSPKHKSYETWNVWSSLMALRSSSFCVKEGWSHMKNFDQCDDVTQVESCGWWWTPTIQTTSTSTPSRPWMTLPMTSSTSPHRQPTSLMVLYESQLEWFLGMFGLKNQINCLGKTYVCSFKSIINKKIILSFKS